MTKKIRIKVLNKKGNEMVEAAIVMPILILSVFLLLRLFTFYLEILNTGIKSHEKALDKWDSYTGVGISKYETHDDVEMLRGGILSIDLHKDIDTKIYFYNEDALVRAGDLIE